MIDTPEISTTVRIDTLSDSKQDASKRRPSLWRSWFGQLVRFGMVGGLNTTIDLLVLNGLLWLFPTTNSLLIVLINSVAYAVGATNSFFLNKYWTFEQRHATRWKEVKHFILVTLLGITCNDILLWCANTIFHPLIAHSSLWVNASKIVAIAGTTLISYTGMRLWVFASRVQKQKTAPLPALVRTDVPAIRSDAHVHYQRSDRKNW